MTPRLHCHWIVNTTPDPTRCATQLQMIKADGFDGVVLTLDLPAGERAAAAAIVARAGEQTELAIWPAEAATPVALADELGLARALADRARAGGEGRLAVALPALSWDSVPSDLVRAVRTPGLGMVTDWVIGPQLYAFDGRQVSGPGHFGWREALPAILGQLREDAAIAAAEAEAGTPELMVLDLAAAPAQVPEAIRRLRLAGHPVHAVAYSELAGATVAGDTLTLGAATYSHVATASEAVPDAVLPVLQALVAAGGSWRRGLDHLPPEKPQLAATTSERFTDVSIRWEEVEPEVNALPLPVLAATAAGEWRAAFRMQSPVDGSLVFMAPVLSPRLNGEPLAVDTLGSVQIAVITGEMLSTDNLLEFATASTPAAAAGAPPFVSLIGDFRVLHDDAGPILAEPEALDTADLAAGGYAYVHRPATVAGTILTHQAHRLDHLQLLEPRAAALRLAIDGVDYGWIWGPDWTSDGLRRLPPGVHDIEISLAPVAGQYYAAIDAAGRYRTPLPAFALPDTLRLHPQRSGD